MKPLTTEEKAEIARYFEPKTEIVNRLPDPKSVRDFAEVVLEANETQKLYKMIKGNWKLVATLT